MKETLKKLTAEAREAIAAAGDEQEIEALRVKYLGKKGELTALLKQMGSLSPEERPVMGQLVNEAKSELDGLITEKGKAGRFGSVIVEYVFLSSTISGRSKFNNVYRSSSLV